MRRAFWGYYFLANGIIVGAPERAIWWTGHPISDFWQTAMSMTFVIIGSAALAYPEKRKGKS